MPASVPQPPSRPSLPTPRLADSLKTEQAGASFCGQAFAAAIVKTVARYREAEDEAKANGAEQCSNSKSLSAILSRNQTKWGG